MFHPGELYHTQQISETKKHWYQALFTTARSTNAISAQGKTDPVDSNIRICYISAVDKQVQMYANVCLFTAMVARINCLRTNQTM